MVVTKDKQDILIKRTENKCIWQIFVTHTDIRYIAFADDGMSAIDVIEYIFASKPIFATKEKAIQSALGGAE